MAENITFGLGGFCAECDDSHDHPLNNIVEIIQVPDLPKID